MDRVIKQTFDEYDPAYSGIIGWAQIKSGL